MGSVEASRKIEGSLTRAGVTVLESMSSFGEQSTVTAIPNTVKGDLEKGFFEFSADTLSKVAPAPFML